MENRTFIIYSLYNRIICGGRELPPILSFFKRQVSQPGIDVCKEVCFEAHKRNLVFKTISNELEYDEWKLAKTTDKLRMDMHQSLYI